MVKGLVCGCNNREIRRRCRVSERAISLYEQKIKKSKIDSSSQLVGPLILSLRTFLWALPSVLLSVHLSVGG